jgi:hypothetical protein
MDYTYPSVFFSYFLFFFFLGGALFFFFRSIRDGYLGKESEAPKYRMLEDEEAGPEPRLRNVSENRA